MEKIALSPHHLIFIIGPPLSGKTTLATALAQRIYCAYIDKDIIQDAFTPQRKGDLYRSIERQTYDVMYDLMEANLKVKNTVLLDAPHMTHMAREEWRKKRSGIAEENGAELCVVQCSLSEVMLRQRLQTRGEKRDKEKLEDPSAFDPLDVAVPFRHIKLKTIEPPERLCDKVMEFLLR